MSRRVEHIEINEHLTKFTEKYNDSALVCHTNLLLTITCTDNYLKYCLGKSAGWDMRHANNRWCPGITGRVSVTCILFNTNHFYRSKLFHFSKNTDVHTIMDRRGTYSMFLTYLKQFLGLKGRFFVCLMIIQSKKYQPLHNSCQTYSKSTSPCDVVKEVSGTLAIWQSFNMTSEIMSIFMYAVTGHVSVTFIVFTYEDCFIIQMIF